MAPARFQVARVLAALVLLPAGIASANPGALPSKPPTRPTYSDKKWPDFAEDLKVAAPQVDPNADAEALVWRIRVLDVLNVPSYHSDVSHYRRIKIFTDRGKEIAGRVDIPYEAKTNVVDLAARTIRPDGSVVEVSRDAFFKRTIVKTSGRKVNVVSFAFPSVETGAIVECRWTERRYEKWANGLALDLQLPVPVRMTELWVSPIVLEGLEFGVRSFNMPVPTFEDAPGGFRLAVLPSTPAWREEPYMPPEFLVRPWIVFFYRQPSDPPPDRFWSEYARTTSDDIGGRMAADASVKQKAVEIAATAGNDGEKLDRLHDFCRSKIRNVDEDAVGEAGSGEPKPSRSPAETLKRGAGTLDDVDYLFGAMARSLGFEARMARTTDRREFLFDPRFQLSGTLREWCVAVRVGDSWRYFDPAARYVPAGMIPWWEEGQQAILIDAKKERFETLPVAPPDSNRAEGIGRFRLLEDGTLEGDATERFTGQWAASLKEAVDDQSPDKRAEDLKAELLARYPGAVVDSIRIEHASDMENALTRAYHVRIPGYAARAGSRLLAPAAFFQNGDRPVFDEPQRRTPIYFSYPSLRKDEILIELPAAFEVEAAPDTKPFAVPGFLSRDSSVQIAMDGRSVRFTRTISTCENREIAFPASDYAAIKVAFERVRTLDADALALRQASEASGR